MMTTTPRMVAVLSFDSIFKSNSVSFGLFVDEIIKKFISILFMFLVQHFFYQKFGYLSESGKLKLKEAFRSGYGIPHEKNTCRTWDGRSPLQKCKFPFKIVVS
jgi:hypothetical protein